MRIIAGPCQHENLEHSLKIAKHCKKICDSLPNVDYVFKASYDKANRSHDDSMRGLGLEPTILAFSEMKKEISGLRIITDVHKESQILKIGQLEDEHDRFKPGEKIVDIYQIPAFLCRQTDLIKLACSSGKIVNIKKGQFIAPWDVEGILSKTQGASEVWITERGTSFGYNYLTVDFGGMWYIMNNFDCEFVFDVTHSVQRPGGMGKTSGGVRENVPPLAYAAAGMGVQNFFMEVHDDPDNAPSDGPNALKLEDFETVVHKLSSIANNLKVFDRVTPLL